MTKHTIAILAALAAHATADSLPAAITAATSTIGATPSSAEGISECQKTVDWPFKLTVVESKNEKRDIGDLEAADCDAGGLVITLKDGTLADQDGRTGYISANFQLQFDSPPQSGAIAGSGFALCPGGSLALGVATTFFECPTGDAWNLYDRRWAEHCGAVNIAARPCGEVEGGEVKGVEGETVVVPTKVTTELEDGQAQVRSTDVGKVVCQLEDGQVQGHTSDCTNTARVTGTSMAPSATNTAHNHTSSAPVTPEDPSTTDDDDSGSSLALHASYAGAGLVLGYLIMATFL